MFTFAVTLCVAYILPTSLAESTVCADLKPMNFMLLGDWGKGGNSGYTYNTLRPDYSSKDDDERNPFYRSSGGGGGGGGNNKQLFYQAAIAKVMGAMAEYFIPSFVLALGDNFYTKGVSSSTDVYWEYLWEDVYLRDYSFLRIPWYPVLGNHDYG
jgi:Calcineurin-like phosphoesterase